MSEKSPPRRSGLANRFAASFRVYCQRRNKTTAFPPAKMSAVAHMPAGSERAY